MAFRLNNEPEQMSLFHRGFILGKRKEKLLNGSWAKIFAEDIFPAMDESIFSPLYSDDAPVNVIVGALIAMPIGVKGRRGTPSGASRYYDWAVTSPFPFGDG